MSRSTREQGFTLIEILVVLAIMATLMAGVAFIIQYAIVEGEKADTTSLINQISGCLKLAASPSNLGEYPPTDTAELRLGRKPIGKELGIPNRTNLGIETVTLVCFWRDMDVGQRIDTKYLINSDEDEAAENVTTHATNALFELRDAWGQPLIYIHHRDYDRVASEPMQVWSINGIVDVRPYKNETTGTWYKLESFQLFSLGPDGEQFTDDDITNF